MLDVDARRTPMLYQCLTDPKPSAQAARLTIDNCFKHTTIRGDRHSSQDSTEVVVVVATGEGGGVVTGGMGKRSVVVGVNVVVVVGGMDSEMGGGVVTGGVE